MTRAVDLRHRISFGKRDMVNPDAPLDLGNVQNIFVEQFSVWAAMQARFGGEAVTAARLGGQQPVTFVVRQSSQTEMIGTDWQIKADGKEYAIRSIVDPDDSGQYYEILTQIGVAS
jgi:SPP1 family predicted phage head-tail adaptor